MDVVSISLPECMLHLVRIFMQSPHSTISFGKKHDRNLEEKRLKLKVYNALFNRQLLQNYKAHSLSWKLLSDQSWDISVVCSGFILRMCLLKKEVLQADRLAFITNKILNVENGRYAPIVCVLFCLAPTIKDCTATTVQSKVVLCRKEREKATTIECVLQFGDLPGFLFNKRYQSIPRSIFADNDWFSLQPFKFDGLASLHTDLFRYSVPHLKKRDTLVNNSSTTFGFNTGDQLHGLSSEIFNIKTSQHDEMSKYSEETLYGGLTHSRTSSMNVVLNLPDISRTNKLDLCSSLKNQQQCIEEDEGFVSPEIISTSFSETSNNFSEEELDSVVSQKFYMDNKPYVGYRTPRYDISSWKNCLDVKLSKHRTWESLGTSARSTKKKWFLSEAGAAVYDFVWKQRLEIVMELANALYQQSRTTNVVKPIPYKWFEVDEATLVHHALLVTVGIPSETFQFNTLAHMYVPMKNVYVPDVTAFSIRSLLLRFADWGTCFRRLVTFASLEMISTHHANENTVQDRGVIFKAFCEGIRNYLHVYQRNLLIHRGENTTLQQLAYTFQRAGTQISYLCRLCQCYDPLDAIPPSSISDFPLGIELLTYLYEEAVHCTETSCYLVLLYLLRKCCQPYLQFVQNWVFYGVCWDATGEFLLRVNNDNGSRKDRARWSNYIQASKPGDIASCVPVFLANAANHMFVCGKTIEFLQHICPQHFLSTRTVPVPDLMITFSKSRMQESTQKWIKFNTDMTDLEQKRTISWRLKEKERERYKRDLLVASQNVHEQQLFEIQSVHKHWHDLIKEEKRIELERLKNQAEEDLERRKVEHLKEKEADRLWQKQVADNSNKAVENEQKLLREAKEEMIAHYNTLYEEVERRKAKANWKIKRHLLHDKRLKRFEEEKILHLLNGKHLKEDNAISTDTASIVAEDVSVDNDRKNTWMESEDSTFSNHMIHKSNVSKAIETNEVPVTEPRLGAEGDMCVAPKITENSSIVSSVVSLPSSDVEVPNSSIACNDSQVANETKDTYCVVSRQQNVQDISTSTECNAINTDFVRSHVSDETVSIEPYVRILKKNQCHVSDQSEPSTVHKPSIKKVGVQHVSQSSVFLTSENNVEISKSHNQAIEENRLFPYSNMPVADNYTLVDSGNETLKSNEKKDGLLRFGLPNLEPLEASEVTPSASQPQLTLAQHHQTNALSNVDDQQHLVVIADHPVESSSSSGTSTEEFMLQLPQSGIYDDDITTLTKQLDCKHKEGSDPLQLIDLYSLVTDDAISVFKHNDSEVGGHTSGEDNKIAFELHTLPVLLSNCVIRPIKSHAALVNRCAINYFMVDLALPRHFEMLQQFLLMEDGEFSHTLCNELFNMVHGGYRPREILNPVTLDSIISTSIQSSLQKHSPLTSNVSLRVKFIPHAFSYTDVNLLNCLELRYHVDWPINIVLTESCHNKYNTVFSFLMQLKHVVWALHDVRTRLNHLDQIHSVVTSSEMRKMHLYRHEMHNFIKVMQGYVSTQIFHVCWKEFQEELRSNVTTLEDLHIRHAEYINKCILRCLLTPKAQNVMNVISDILKCILRFRAQLATRQSTVFAHMQRTYQEFARFSNFLYKVVSKLVQRGYQPHLEDFLIRLNFNGFYKS